MFHFGLSDKRVAPEGLQVGPITLPFRGFAGMQSVRFGSKADACSATSDVRFGPKADIIAYGLHLKKAWVIRVGLSHVALNSSSPPQCGQGSFWVSVDCKAAPLVTQKAAKPASCCVVLSRLPNHFRACQQWRQAFATVAQPPKDRGEVLAAFARRDPHTASHWTDKFQRLTA